MATQIEQRRTETQVKSSRSGVRGARKGRKRAWLIILLLLLVVLILTPFLIVHFINESQKARIYDDINEVPARPVAMIFGAGLRPDGSPSAMLADRLDTGIQLYKDGKVSRLMMTGDGISNTEVQAMKQYAQRNGVPAAAIITDKGGLRTYDSCWRAANSFQINQAILVTQAYHLPRALYLCNSLGVDAVGLKAGLERYTNQDWYNSREFFAVLASWFDVNISKPTPEASR